MARTWLINSRGLARKVKNATQFSQHQIKDWATDAKRECPNCHHLMDNSDVLSEWPGLPAGVKFDPSDIELVEHLAGKNGSSEPHLFIDEFIPTLGENEGICYTHPEKLPGEGGQQLCTGIKKDGSSVHFFHKISNAYATGHRKRRKIDGSYGSFEGRVRWHKTGKTKPIIEEGIQKGFKKIMVLYKSLKRGSKPDKSNWVMHQYHLGNKEDEKEGEFVVSKVFYQQQPMHLTDKGSIKDLVPGESDVSAARYSPKTPKRTVPHPPRQGNIRVNDDVDEERQLVLPCQDAEFMLDTFEAPLPVVNLKDEVVSSACWAGEYQIVEVPSLNDIDDSLLCHEMLDSNPFGDSGFNLAPNLTEFGGSRSEPQERDINDLVWDTSGLDNLELGTPPDFDLVDLQFGSQDSIFGWLDRL